jgi:hypothetical protein
LWALSTQWVRRARPLAGFTPRSVRIGILSQGGNTNQDGVTEMVFNIAAYLLAPLMGFVLLIVQARATGRWRKPLQWSALGCLAFPLLSLLITLAGVPLEFVACSTDCMTLESIVGAATQTTTAAAVISLAAGMTFLTLVLARHQA